MTSDDTGIDAPRLFGFEHTPVGGSSVNTVYSSSRLLLPVPDE